MSNLSQDGILEFQPLTKNYVEKAIEMMEEAYFLQENTSRVIGIAENPEAIEEMQDFLREIAKDGTTFIAVEKSTGRVVGAAFNKLLVTGDSFFGDFAKNCKIAQSRYLLDAMCTTHKLYEACDVDCYFEIVFLGTSTEFRGRGIGKKLCEMSVELATKLFNGINAKQSVDGTELNLEPVPKMVASTFSTFITQRIGQQLGFEILREISYDTLEYEGRLYSSIIGEKTKSIIFEYKKLQ